MQCIVLCVRTQVIKLKKKLAQTERSKKVQQTRVHNLKNEHEANLAKKDIQIAKKNKIITETSESVRMAREKVFIHVCVCHVLSAYDSTHKQSTRTPHALSRHARIDRSLQMRPKLCSEL